MLFICKKKKNFMRKIVSVSVVAIFILASCLKKESTCNYSDSTVVAPEAEQEALADSLSAHGITASLHPAGFYYKINSQGSGSSVANLCTTLSVEYKGGFFNGKVFDSTLANEPVNLELGGVITGWQKGVPLVNSDGDITLYVPPSLAYGPNPVINQSTRETIIPANSYLVFNIHVVDIQ
jgi:FKBP-type peptidyl-prolyl cis-trans isomerase FkpA